MTRPFFIRITVLVSVLTAVAGVGAYYAVPPLLVKPHLVIIVPGTYSNDNFWPTVPPDKVTFGSELEVALGAKGKVYPFLWSSSIKNQNREEAARHLAEYIDSQSLQYPRISLVGHSHGGNVALLAAGLCQTPLDKIVCLATPHAYLRTKCLDGRPYAVPIYCSRRSLENSQSIISIVASTDAVPSFWSSGLLIGLRESDANRLTQSWRDELQQPRLADDSFFARLLFKSNVATTRELSVATHNLRVVSRANDLFGQDAHSQIHSRQLGKLVGELLSDREGSLESLRNTVIPADADDGEPIPARHASCRPGS
jgi:pimeloyl-ACP methyl ester carboxylesterase